MELRHAITKMVIIDRQRKQREAEKEKAWRIEKGTYLKKCARCGMEGIPEWDSAPGDEKFTKILEVYRDADSQYDGMDLCFACGCLEDMTVSNYNAKIERIGRIPDPWE